MKLRIVSPCRMSWDAMPGDARVRHCSLCNLNVHNVAQMTPGELRELVLRTEGRLCVRLDRRSEPTVLKRVATAIIAALLSVSAFASPRMRTHGAKVKLSVERAGAVQKAALTGVVGEGTNGPIPGITVTVRNEATRSELTAITDTNGAFTIASLDEGLYRVQVSLEGFQPATIEHLSMKANEVVTARVTLRMDVSEDIVVGGAAVDPLSNGVSTWFPQDFINKLPR